MKASEKVLLDRINQVIESNFHNPDFGIDEICRELGTSRSQLYRYIKEHTQLSISLYIRQRKLLKAAALLASSEMKTAEIAYFLGIDSPQNFSKYFTQEYGLTPSAYRKKVAEERIRVDSGEIGNNEILIEEAQQPVVQKKKSIIFPGKFLYFGFGIIVCIVCVLYFRKAIEKSNTESSTGTAFSGNSVAVMPFKNLGSPETGYFADGIMEQIHGSLSLIRKLKVISTASSRKYKSSSKLIPQIARELGVSYVLAGSVLQTGQKIRINVELIRASDDRSVWTKSYDGTTDDVFSYLSTVSSEVAQELDQKLSNATQEKLARIPTSNPEAYNEYLKGSQLIMSRKKEQLEESVVRLSNAIKLDPDFSDAYARMGLAYCLLGESNFIEEQLSFKMTEQNSLTAIRLDPENGLAYANLANIYRVQYKWEPAKTAYEIALKYNPNDAQINYWFSLLLRTTGNLKEAIRYSDKAMELDPLDHIIFGGGVVNYIYGGELEMAKKKLKDGQILFTDSFAYYWVLARYFGGIGDFGQALKNVEKADQLNPGIKSIGYQIVYYKARLGRVDEVNSFLKNLPELPENYISRAVIFAGLGDKKQSLYYLQKGADRGLIPTDIKVFPFLTVLHKEPQFKSILQKFGL